MNDDSAADLLGPADVLRIQDQGRTAALAGEHPSACPYRPSTAEDAARARMWARGYAAGRTALRPQ